MSHREQYAPGPAAGASVDKDVHKDGDKWALVVVRELRHPPEMVWQALTDPAQLSEWAPFDADRNLADAGIIERVHTNTLKRIFRRRGIGPVD